MRAAARRRRGSCRRASACRANRPRRRPRRSGRGACGADARRPRRRRRESSPPVMPRGLPAYAAPTWSPASPRTRIAPPRISAPSQSPAVAADFDAARRASAAPAWRPTGRRRRSRPRSSRRRASGRRRNRPRAATPCRAASPSIVNSSPSSASAIAVQHASCAARRRATAPRATPASRPSCRRRFDRSASWQFAAAWARMDAVKVGWHAQGLPQGVVNLQRPRPARTWSATTRLSASLVAILYGRRWTHATAPSCCAAARARAWATTRHGCRSARETLLERRRAHRRKSRATTSTSSSSPAPTRSYRRCRQAVRIVATTGARTAAGADFAGSGQLPRARRSRVRHRVRRTAAQAGGHRVALRRWAAVHAGEVPVEPTVYDVARRRALHAPTVCGLRNDVPRAD